MMKCSIRIGVLIIVFSAMFLVLASGTKAESQDGPKKGLVSELHLEAASHQAPGSYSVGGTGLKSNPLRGFLVPLKEGLTAFIDCAPPPHQEGLTPEDAGTNYRAVIGFHFSLR